MIYVEYISRRPGVTLADFHAAVETGQEGWDATYQEDHLIWSAGRTWRLGPAPEYLGVWYSPHADFERIDDWERIFRGGEAEIHENVFRKVATIEAAGCYRPLREPVRARGQTYYVEYFRPGTDSNQTSRFFEERARRHAGFTLNLLVERIGRLAPEPGGIAVWSIPTFAALASIASELDGLREPIELVAAGTYADVGQEIL
ncbi:MAG TPA: hypothetical protein VKT80_14020 [Chloroflexota bacterium]|nr:hypothetical protein [Chloroflexota bacterium]